MELFEEPSREVSPAHAPLAERMRPSTLQEFVGQSHLFGEGKLLRRAIEQDRLTSMILWGPPGTGKTSLAQVIARQTHAHFVALSAVLAGVSSRKPAHNAIGMANVPSCLSMRSIALTKLNRMPSCHM